MPTHPYVRIASALLASSTIVAGASVAYANGQGTPIEPVSAPAPTVLQPAGPSPAVTAPARRARSGWGGFYVGVHLGYGWSGENEAEVFNFDTNLDGVYNDTVLTATTGGTNFFAPGFCGGAATANTNTACEEDQGGFDGGLRAGYDWDFDGLVLGVVGEVSMAEVTDSVSGFTTAPGRYTFTRELNYLLAARLRAGYAFGSVLVYGTGGYAFGDLDRTFTTNNTANTFTASNDDAASGWQLGGGIETMLTDSLSFGVEYIYTSLDDSEYAITVARGTAPVTSPFIVRNAAGTSIKRSDDRFELHSVRATVALRFGE